MAPVCVASVGGSARGANRVFSRVREDALFTTPGHAI